ncbi:MAG: hypothetical protein ACTHU0_35805 [Kofleriaceae bacterium]
MAYDGSVRIVDAASGKPGRTLAATPHRIEAVAFHPDGRLLASSEDGLEIWDAVAGTRSARSAWPCCPMGRWRRSSTTPPACGASRTSTQGLHCGGTSETSASSGTRSSWRATTARHGFTTRPISRRSRASKRRRCEAASIASRSRSRRTVATSPRGPATSSSSATPRRWRRPGGSPRARTPTKTSTTTTSTTPRTPTRTARSARSYSRDHTSRSRPLTSRRCASSAPTAPPSRRSPRTAKVPTSSSSPRTARSSPGPPPT